MGGRRSWIAAGAAVLAVAAGVAARPADAGSRCGYAAGGSARIAVPVPGGGTRTARLHMPRTGRGARPLLVALHGTGGSGAFMERYSRLSALADRAASRRSTPTRRGARGGSPGATPTFASWTRCWTGCWPAAASTLAASRWPACPTAAAWGRGSPARATTGSPGW
jgi:hypothetical protein